MSQTKNTSIAPLLKSLLVTFFKFVAIVAAFVFRILSSLFQYISDLLEKASGNDKHH